MAVDTAQPLYELYPASAWPFADAQHLQRSLTVKEREAIDDEDFAGPDHSFPIDTQAHLDAAEHLIGHAADPAAVKQKAIAIAKRKGFTLPKSWQDDEKDTQRMDASALPQDHKPLTDTHTHPHSDASGATHDHLHTHVNDNIHVHQHEIAGDVPGRGASPTVARAADHPHTGTHIHSHPAFGSQGNDATHEHLHSHEGDSNHDHAHEESRAALPTVSSLYFPIVEIDRSDPNKWEVEGVATSEAVDSFGTIFSYDASKKAFKEWIDRTANVREMHERKAVGKGIGVRFDDDAKKIYVRTRVSKGAPDTWTKICEGVLDGFSVGATDPVWGSVERNGKTYPYLIGYKTAELSLVDNASNPDGQGLLICRADGLTAVIDVSEEPTPQVPATIERVGKPISAATAQKLHDSIGHTLMAAKSQMQTCADGGCPDCAAALLQIDPDSDGDVDCFGGCYGDTDNDAASLQAAPDDSDIEARMTAIVERVVSRLMTPVYQKQQHFLARMAQTPEDGAHLEPELIRSAIAAELTPTMTALNDTLAATVERMATLSSLDEVRSLLSGVKDQVDRIAAQPDPRGAPVLSGGVPIERTASHSANGAPDQAAVRAVLDQLQARGALNTPEAQTAAAALLIQPMALRR